MHLNINLWLTLNNLPGIGCTKILNWLTHFSSIENLFAANLNQLKSAGLTSAEINLFQQADDSQNTESLNWSQQPHHHLISYDNPHYPVLLRELNDAPLILYVSGDVTLLQKPQIAIVGTRNPTHNGRENAEQFAYCLAQSGAVITSGLAMGVDAAAHQGALAAQSPTIAVMGTGLNHIYPLSHQQLAAEISQTGALVSEFPPTMLAMAKNFPRRNRIISGMSLGTVVIEAALRSGSLITARLAAEQGREVFALPGSIHNPLARGCHQLIRQGAKLVETAADIIEELGMLQQTLQLPLKPVATAVLEQKHRDLLACLTFEKQSVDTILVRSGLTVSQVSSMLCTLELQGYVNFVSGGWTRSTRNFR